METTGEKNGKSRTEHVREEHFALTCRFERDISTLLGIADAQAQRDLADDPLIKDIHDAAKLGLELELPERKQAQLCKIINSADRLMEMDYAQIEGQAIRELIKPYQDKVAEIQSQLKALSLSCS